MKTSVAIQYAAMAAASFLVSGLSFGIGGRVFGILLLAAGWVWITPLVLVAIHCGRLERKAD
jgi:hypothetical protein